MQFVSV